MYVVIDIETTGLNPRWERITEIAIYVFDGNSIIDHFTTLINPERLISPQITALTGITNSMLENAPKFYQIAKKIVELTKDKIFVGHNVNFDYNFVRAEFQHLGYDFTRKTLCTVKLSKKIIPGLPSYSLGNICKSLGIINNNRHRAQGDAYATTLLFERLIKIEGQSGLSFSDISAIPFKDLHPELKKEKIELLPDSTGVYYLFNSQNELIYIGKSLNIRKRVIQHLQKSKNISMNEMRQHIVDVHYEITGSELIALLLESEEIKKNKPLFNRQQRRTMFTNGLYFYYDKNGYINFIIDKTSRKDIPLAVFSSKLTAKSCIENLQKQHNLCQKLCGLYPNSGACFEYSIHKCLGACTGIENQESYNSRALKVVEHFDSENQCYYIIDRGRNIHEKSVVNICNGKYMGFGFIDTETFNGQLESLNQCITIKKDNRDIQLIIRQYLKKNKVEKVISYDIQTIQ